MNEAPIVEPAQVKPDEPTVKPAAKSSTKPASPPSGKIAIVLVRGPVGVMYDVKHTLKMLRLTHKNFCVVVDDSLILQGMLKKIKDYVTWGTISQEVYDKLVASRGEEYKGRTTDRKEKYTYKFDTINNKKYKPYFRLQAPRKGFGRKGIKIPFTLGGALGNRAEKINDLLERMI